MLPSTIYPSSLFSGELLNYGTVLHAPISIPFHTIRWREIRIASLVFYRTNIFLYRLDISLLACLSIKNFDDGSATRPISRICFRSEGKGEKKKRKGREKERKAREMRRRTAKISKKKQPEGGPKRYESTPTGSADRARSGGGIVNHVTQFNKARCPFPLTGASRYNLKKSRMCP